jgi:hypothetical protein
MRYATLHAVPDERSFSKRIYRIGSHKIFMRAQVAMEYMVMFGICLILVTVLWFYVDYNTGVTEWDLQAAYAKHAVNKLVTTSDTVYIQGYPAQSSVYVTFPNNVESVLISGKTVQLNLRTGNLTASISQNSLGTIVGNISARQGGHEIIVKAEVGYVNITETS